VPSHCSALGKVFLAWGVLEVPEGPLAPQTAATITDPERLRRAGDQARRRGWAVTADELEVGLTGLAVPVHGPRGDVVAALGISGPTPRLEGRLDDLGCRLLERAAELSMLLRGRTPKKGVA
jgi:DNA-binding IclR family transcriptional regulator